MVELAMDDHSNARDYLQQAQARVASKGLFAAAVAEGIYSAHGDLEDDYEDFADVVEDYLMEDFDSADERALKLMEIEDSVDEVLEKNRKISRRWLLLGGAGMAAAAAGGAFVGTQGSNNNGGSTGVTGGTGDGTEFQAGESYSMGPPDDFDSLIEGDSEFYDWIANVNYEIDDLGAETYLTETDGVGATVRELESYDEDNDLAVLGETVLGELEPDDLNQRRIE